MYLLNCFVDRRLLKCMRPVTSVSWRDDLAAKAAGFVDFGDNGGVDNSIYREHRNVKNEGATAHEGSKIHITIYR